MMRVKNHHMIAMVLVEIVLEEDFRLIVRQVLAPRERRHMCICNLQIVDIYQNIRPRQHTGDIGNDAI